jgi:hypothetical protein
LSEVVRGQAASERALHSSLAMTMDRYGHLFISEGHKRAIDTIAKELFG